MAKSKHKRVALLIESMMAPRRMMLNGVARFMQENEQWSIYLMPPYIDSAILDWIRNWNCDGIIGKLTRGEIEGLQKAKIPCVDMRGEFQHENVCTVRADDVAIGRVGAEHLLERGFKHFAFLELADAFWATARFEGFAARLKESGFKPDRHTAIKPSARPAGPDYWERRQHAMGQWMLKLPKPVGIMASTDFMGMHALDACQRVGIRVPESAAIVGADNDEPICRISNPQLSSVIINDEQRGYKAAAVLSELMSGELKTGKVVLISPTGVKTRASTDVFAFDDSQMVQAMQYLREHCEDYRGIDAMAAALQVSRSTLERKFRKIWGRSVNDELVRIRVDNAVRLLSETQLPLKAVALRCGFSSQAYMTSVLKSKTGRTPNSYRR